SPTLSVIVMVLIGISAVAFIIKNIMLSNKSQANLRKQQEQELEDRLNKLLNEVRTELERKVEEQEKIISSLNNEMTTLKAEKNLMERILQGRDDQTKQNNELIRSTHEMIGATNKELHS